MALYLRNPKSVLQLSKQIIAFCTESGLTSSIPIARIHHGWALAQLGEKSEGIKEIREAIADWTASGMQLALPYLNMVLAEAYILDDRGEDAVELCEEALARIRSTGEGELESPILYTKGDALLAAAMSDDPQVEDCYLEALEVARSQSAKSWELRAATRLARLWHSQGKTSEARDLLAPIYGWFTEGFDTADLMAAKALLEQFR